MERDDDDRPGRRRPRGGGLMLTESDLARIERVLDACSDLDRRAWWYGQHRDFLAALRAAWREKRYWLEHYALDINGYLHCRWCGRQYSAWGHTEECPAGCLEEEARAALVAPGAGGQATEEQ